MRLNSIIALAGCLCFGVAQAAFAHGVKLTQQPTSAIEIQAAYDSGTPMVNAQVNVYAPDNPASPWRVGVTDDQGVFVFVPDPQKSGYWEVQVRQAGHGGVVSIPVGPDLGIGKSTPAPVQSSGSGVYNPLQKGIMLGSVIWGLVGTALFFSRRKSEGATGTLGSDTPRPDVGGLP